MEERHDLAKNIINNVVRLQVSQKTSQIHVRVCLITITYCRQLSALTPLALGYLQLI